MRPAIGSLATITFGEPPARATEMVSPVGDSNETSSVPACVTIIDGTTMFWTPPESVVQAPAAGTATSAADRASAARATRRI